MKHLMRNIWIIAAMLLLSSGLFAQKGHKIEVQVDGVSDTTMMLGHHFGKKKFVVDTVMADENGYAVFEGDEPLDRGIYILVLPSENNAYFELLVGDDQKFKLITSTENYVENMKVKGSTANKVFNEYQRKMAEFQQEIGTLQSELESLPEDDKAAREKIRDQLKEIGENRKAYMEKVAEENEGDLFGAIINAILEPEIPDPPRDEEGNMSDSAFQYRYYRDHYFDNIDFSEAGLLRTPIFEPKLDAYFENVIPPVPDSVIPIAHDLIAEAQDANYEVFKYMTSHLLNYFETSKVMGMDAVFVSIAEDWYLSGEADWADSTLRAKIEERVLKITPTIIGQKSADIEQVPTFDERYASLHALENDYTILVFWEPDCGHCKKVLPRLHELYLDTLQDINVDVFAVYTQVDKEEWTEFIYDKEIDELIHVWDPYGRTNFRNNYDIYSTPVIYILDDEKRIVAKRIDVEFIPKFLKYEHERKEKEAKKNADG
ncbi:MAG: thioredoxin-like domain-containing protein [Bacteroidales bacterium]